MSQMRPGTLVIWLHLFNARWSEYFVISSDMIFLDDLTNALLWIFLIYFLSHSMSADPQWAISDWVSQDDEESVLEAILQQSAQEFYSSKE